MKMKSTKSWWIHDGHFHALRYFTKTKWIKTWLFVMTWVLCAGYCAQAQVIQSGGSTPTVQEQGICASSLNPTIHVELILENGNSSDKFWTSATTYSIVTPTTATVVSSTISGGSGAYSTATGGTTTVQLEISVPAATASSSNLAITIKAEDASHTIPIDDDENVSVKYYLPNNANVPNEGLKLSDPYCENTAQNTTAMEIKVKSSAWGGNATSMARYFNGPQTYDYSITGPTTESGQGTITTPFASTTFSLPKIDNPGDHTFKITKITDAKGCVNDGTMMQFGYPQIDFTVLELPEGSENFAGADAFACINVDKELAAQDPSTYISGASGATGGATGMWTITSANAADATITPMNEYNADFKATQAGVYTLKWTVSNGASCSAEDLVEITVREQPIATIASATAQLCIGDDIILDGNNPTNIESTASGEWSVDNVTYFDATIPATGTTGDAQFADKTAYNTVFTPDGYGKYTLKWTVKNSPCMEDAATKTITVSDTTSEAGSDQFVCIGDMVTMAANDPSKVFGPNSAANTGVWSFVENPMGTGATAPATYNGTFTADKSGTYELLWKIDIDGALCTGSDMMKVYVQPDVKATASATSICAGDNVVLTGTDSATSGGATKTGTWTVSSIVGSGQGTMGTSGTFAPDANSPTATFTPDGYGLYTLKWSVEYKDPDGNTICTKVDNVEVDVLENPAVDAHVGFTNYIDICEGSSVTLDGTDPDGMYAGGGSSPTASNTSSGIWTANSSNSSFGNFTNFSSYNTSYNTTTSGVDTLKWNITTTDGTTSCSVTDSDRVIVRTTPIADANTGGTYDTVCYGEKLVLSANDAGLIDDTDADDGNSKGFWSIVSGPNTDTAQFNGTSTSHTGEFKPDYLTDYAILKGDTQVYTLRWNTENHPCANTTDNVNVAVWPVLEAAITGVTTTNICNGGGVTVNISKPAVLDGPFSGTLYISTNSPSGMTSSYAFDDSEVTATAGSSMMTVTLPNSSFPNTGSGSVTYDISWGANNTEGNLSGGHCDAQHDKLTGSVSVNISTIPDGEIASTSIAQACADPNTPGPDSDIKFAALAGTGPYTFFYDLTVDGTLTATNTNLNVATLGGSSERIIQQNMNTAGTFDYELRKVEASGCVSSISNQNTKIVVFPEANPAPVENATGTVSGYSGGIASNSITFNPGPTFTSFTEEYSVDSGATWSKDPAFTNLADKCDGYGLMTRYVLKDDFGPWAKDSSMACTESAVTNVFVDVTAPTATIADTVIMPMTSCDTTFANILNDFGYPDITENCKVVSVTNNAPASGLFLGSHSDLMTSDTTWVIEWTIVDTAGNSVSINQNVTIKDVVAPDVTAPADVTVSSDLDQCSAATAPLGSPMISDYCGIESVLVDSADHQPYQVGETELTWTITDVNGNETQVTQKVIVEDNQDPLLIAPPATTLDNDKGFCYAGIDMSILGGLGVNDTTDNCGIDASTLSISPTGPLSVGVHTVTWTVKDIHGNEVTATQMVTVKDMETPIITAPSVVTLDADMGDCGRILNIADLNANSDLGLVDNCEIDSNTLSISPTYLSVGVNQSVTWYVEDIHGNSTTATQMVNIVDAEHPVLNAPADVTLNADMGDCARTLTIADLGGIAATDTSDNCGIKASTLSFSPTTASVGTTAVTWSIEDIHGNITTSTQNVTINDAEDPILVAPANITLDADMGDCSRMITMADLGGIAATDTTDNCGIDASTLSISPTGPLSIGTHTITWSVEDIHGNIVSKTQDVTIEDNEDPILVAPQSITLNNDPGSCDATIDMTILGGLGALDTTDNCGIDASSLSISPSGPLPIGTHTVTWSVKDIHNNMVTDVQTVVVEDNEKPSLTTPSTQILSPGAGCTVIMPDYTGLFNISDNCSQGTDLTIVQLAPNEVGETIIGYGGSRTVRVAATDQYGNTDTAEFTLNISDTTAPTAVCIGSIDVGLDANGMATITGSDLDDGSTDNCDGSLTFTANITSFDCSNLGPNAVTMTATDDEGNSSVCIASVNVIDTLAPTITCAADTTLPKDAMCTTILPDLTFRYSGSDNCTDNANLVVTQSPAAGSIIAANVSMVPITLTVTDAKGNAADCTFNTYFVDDQKPIVSGVPANIQLNTSAYNGSCSIPVSWTPPTATDNCSLLVPSDITVTSTHNPGDNFANGLTSVSYTFTDTAGNDTTVSFDINIIDDSKPTTANLDANILAECSVTLPTPVAYDSCDGPINGVLLSGITSASLAAGDDENTPYVSEWQFTDAAGNSSTFTQTIILDDTTAPVPDMASLAPITDECSVDIATLIPPTATDNCSGMINATPSITGVIDAQGTTTVTWTYDDNHGNSATQTQDIVITDVTPPTFANCPSDQTVAPNITGCEYQVVLNTPTVNDNCDVSNVNVTWAMTGAVTASGSGVIGSYNFPIGTTTITYTATDAGGNMTDCSYDLTVENNTVATISGSSTAVQHSTQTSTVTFAATGGTSPYTFTFTKDGGASVQTVSTALGDSVVTVAHSNQFTGSTQYEILSVMDANGCAGQLPATPDKIVTITILAAGSSPLDFSPSIPRPSNATFVTGLTREGYIRVINNSATTNPSAPVSFVVSAPANFIFDIPAGMTTAAGQAVDNANWTITPYLGGSILLLESTSNTSVNAGTSVYIGYSVQATGISGTAGNLNVTISTGTGAPDPNNGDFNDNNNATIKNFIIN